MQAVSGRKAVDEKPVFDAMIDAGIITKRMFNLCLGKNGGYFQIGGYNTDKHLEPVKWFNMLHKQGSYEFGLIGVSMGNRMLENSATWKVGFIDSGTTFTYIPIKMWDQLVTYFDYHCEHAKNSGDGNADKYCPGKRFNTVSDGAQVMCFRYDPKKQSRKEFLMGYPVINFYALDTHGMEQRFKWFPSEYLYLEKDGKKYCLTADKEGTTQITFGSTLMRQNDFIFDNEDHRIGIARSKCNDDRDMIITEQDYVDYGTTYGMDLNLVQKA